MIHEFSKPILCLVEDNKEAYAIYCESSGMFENDVWTCVLVEGGFVRHYTTEQIKIHINATFGIVKKQK